MPTTYKVLGQSAPTDTNNADLYTVGSGKSAVISTISITNDSGAAATAQIYIRVSGATASLSNALVYNTSFAANSTTALTFGITLAETDVVSVRTSVANALTFMAFGSEIS